MYKYGTQLWHRARYWRAYREAGPLIAQSLYESLSPEEESRLDRLIADFPDLGKERNSFLRISDSVKLEDDHWTGDLLPTLKQQIAQTAQPRRNISHARAYGFAVTLVLLFSAALYAMFMLGGEPAPVFHYAEQEAAEEETALSRASTAACDLVAQGDPERAAELLAEAIELYPEDVYHADAILTLADIEYTYLQHYERAYETFKRLEQEHHEVYDHNWVLDKRMRLLAAALPFAFEPLRELETAAHSENPLRGYENILAQYPDKLWADEAMRQMSRLIARNTEIDPADTVQMLQCIRHACAHPVALERVDLELGNYYCNALDDAKLARQYYRQAAASRHVALASQAREALARLD